MNAYVGSAVAVLMAVQIVFILALIMKRNDYADIFWGPGFVIAVLGALFLSGRDLNSLAMREVLIIGCISLWALRLFWHIGLRSLLKGKEDIRYLNWRNEWGKNWIWRTYLQVFILQALILLVVALPAVYSVDQTPREMTGFVYAGILIWIFGFIFESVSDSQLKKFKADPGNKGKLMTSGLWSLSRHPNYFGEVIQWWGIFLMAVQLNSLWLIVSPILITYLIVKVSGIPMLEKLMEGRPGFEEYKAKTSIFVPWLK